MDPAVRRRDILGAWRGFLLATGQQPVPTAEDLRAIALAGSPEAWPQTLDSSTVDPWRPTIEWLLRQAKLGVTDPLDHLPPELARPVPPRSPARDPLPPGSEVGREKQGENPELSALRRWWREGVARNAPGFATLKDRDLRRIVSAPTRDPEELAKLLGDEALRGRSAEIAALLMSASTPDPADGAPAPQPTGGNAASAADPKPSTPAEPARTEPAEAVPPGDAGPQDAARPADDAGSPAGRQGRADLTTSPGERSKGTPPQDEPATDPLPTPSSADFDAFDFTSAVGEPVNLEVARTPQGSSSLRWPEAELAGYTVYRVVASDDFPPYAPERGDLVEITSACVASDDRPFTSAVRHYQVWRNSGRNRQAALHSQPHLHAASSVVGPVLDVDIRPDGGSVIGQWRVHDGVEQVHVYRIPLAQAARAGISGEYRILAEDDNLAGFRDTGVTPGNRYLYRVCAVGRVDGVARLSAPAAVEVVVPAVLSPVTDLRVEAIQSAGTRVFELGWTDPPAGRVSIYRTSQPPLAGAASDARPLSVLPQMGLEEANRLSHPIRRVEGRASMHEVPWPEGWTRAYFTPVTILEGTAHVGVTAAATWVPPAGVPRLVERVYRQVLTFAWPSGAAFVLVHVGPRDASVDAARGGGRTCEISQAQYRELGGLTFPFLLPSEGCAVHIVPVAFSAGERVEGIPVSVDYQGLLRVRYRTSMKRNLTRKLTTLTVEITSDIPVAPPPFALVHNPDRLPLDIGDGTALEAFAEGDETMAGTRRPLPARLAPDAPSRWKVDVRGAEGYVRLFVDLPPQHLRRVALLDPPVAQLRLEPLFGGRG